MLESDQTEAKRFIHFMNTAGRLHVSVRQGDTWVEQTSLADVVSHIIKDQIAMLDVASVPEDDCAN